MTATVDTERSTGKVHALSPDTSAAVRRLPAVDALRGFALLGILMVNSTQIMDPYVSAAVRTVSPATGAWVRPR
ncbi:hypothetical protein [Streptomyces poonensis]|uniref:Uncharacterized protein n=1 Tax=Streptomyces poonensis TaxID=68255 RepID=A0A918PJY2_9ACTN|nr:hypothetical protein [Streptomyces poonensis]GGZ13081.1 hypothetical protein GCM10010365_36090 [Streptomyces poonensis]GLJ91936.1 hypothetical protein GCM10017589_45440 [Streptomyces poonensis]